MEFPESSAGEYLSCHSLSPENMVGFLPHSQGASSQSFISSKEPVEIMELQAPALSQNTSPIENLLIRERTPVKISWNHGGNLVALVGSWDNWETREIMQRIGTRFQVLKTLPSGIYHYRFVVDGWLVCAPDLPWVSDDSGNPCNILDLPENESEMLESLSEFECPPSPESSYDNQILNEDDFSKPPPELPPQLRTTVLNGQSTSDDESCPMPLHTELNHLYVQSNHEGWNCYCCCAEQGRETVARRCHRYLNSTITTCYGEDHRRGGHSDVRKRTHHWILSPSLSLLLSANTLPAFRNNPVLAFSSFPTQINDYVEV